MSNVAFIAIALTLCGVVAFAQDVVQERLENSPRHHEWVAITYGDRTVHAFVAYPEVADPTLAVIVIHENRGLNDWARSAADQVAEAGYIAIAPDLLSGAAPGGGKTSDFVDADAAREGIYGLTPDQVTADLNAVADYALKLPSCNGKIAVGGFCWGGSQSFRFATNRMDLVAACVFYGTGPDDDASVARIKAPVYGFYGGADNRVNASIPVSEKLMEEAGKVYEPVIYDGAGHAFMRSGEMPDGSAENKAAREAAWKRWSGILAKYNM